MFEQTTRQRAKTRLIVTINTVSAAAHLSGANQKVQDRAGEAEQLRRVDATAHPWRAPAVYSGRPRIQARHWTAYGYILATSTRRTRPDTVSLSEIGLSHPPASQAEGRGFEARRPLYRAGISAHRASRCYSEPDSHGDRRVLSASGRCGRPRRQLTFASRCLSALRGT
jgi:hypothetical protein